MKRNISIFIVSLIVTIGVILIYVFIFNSKEDVKSILSKRDLSKFENSVRKKAELNDIRGHWVYLRDIAPNFKEGIFEFQQYIKNDNGVNTNSYEVFQVKMITNVNKIIYYEYNTQKNKKVKHEWRDTYSWEPYYVLIERYKSELEFKILKQTFRKVFDFNFNEKELFLNNYVYGENCGIAAMNSKERIQLNNYVINKDKKSIVNWLKSTNSEKQIYAIEGLLKLEKAGIKMDKKELKVFEYIIKKNGTIKACFGCNYSAREINYIVDLIKLNL